MPRQKRVDEAGVIYHAIGGLDVRVALAMASDDGTSSENPFTMAHSWPSALDQPGQ